MAAARVMMDVEVMTILAYAMLALGAHQVIRNHHSDSILAQHQAPELSLPVLSVYFQKRMRAHDANVHYLWESPFQN